MTLPITNFRLEMWTLDLSFRFSRDFSFVMFGSRTIVRDCSPGNFSLGNFRLETFVWIEPCIFSVGMSRGKLA